MRTAPPTVPGMLTPNSIPRQAPVGGLSGDLGQPRAAARDDALGAASLDRSQLAGELHHEPAEPLVRHQQVRARADDADPEVLGVGPGEQLDQGIFGVRLCEVVGRPADPHGGQPRQRIVALDPVGRAHEASPTSVSARRKMSPAPIVKQHVALAQLGPERAGSLLGVGQPPHRPAAGVRRRPPRRRAARSRPREGPPAARAPGRRRGRRSRPLPRARSRTRSPAPWSASRGAAGRRRSGERGSSSRAAASAARDLGRMVGVVVVDARSRRLSLQLHSAGHSDEARKRGGAGIDVCPR